MQVSPTRQSLPMALQRCSALRESPELLRSCAEPRTSGGLGLLPGTQQGTALSAAVTQTAFFLCPELHDLNKQNKIKVMTRSIFSMKSCFALGSLGHSLTAAGIPDLYF